LFWPIGDLPGGSTSSLTHLTSQGRRFTFLCPSPRFLDRAPGNPGFISPYSAWTGVTSATNQSARGDINFLGFCFRRTCCKVKSGFRDTWASTPWGWDTDAGGTWRGPNSTDRPQGFCGTHHATFSPWTHHRCGKVTLVSWSAGLGRRLGGDDSHRFTTFHQLVCGPRHQP